MGLILRVQLIRFLAGTKVVLSALRKGFITEPRVLIKYISLLIYPLESRLTMFHDIEISTGLFIPWTTLPAAILIVDWPHFGWPFAQFAGGLCPAYCLLFFFHQSPH